MPLGQDAGLLLAAVVLQLAAGAAPAAESQPASLDITLGVAADRERDAALIEGLPADGGPTDVLVDGKPVATWYAIDPSAETADEEGRCVLRANPSSGRREILVLLPPFTVGRDDIEGIWETTDQWGKLAVGIRVDEQTSRALRATTGRWQGRHAAFVVNGSVRWLPTVQAPVGSLMIAGPYAAEYLDLAREESVKVAEEVRWWALWAGGAVALCLLIIGLIVIRRFVRRAAARSASRRG